MRGWAVLASIALLVAAAGPAVALGQVERDWVRARLAENDAGRPGLGGGALSAPGEGRDAALAVAIVNWDRLRRDSFRPRFEEAADFLARWPGWPQERAIRLAAERAVDGTAAPAARIAHFEKVQPLTGAGWYWLADAYRAVGRGEDARRAVMQAWRSADLGDALEAEALSRFGGMLTRDDHEARAETLLWARNPAAARRLLPLLEGQVAQRIGARVALQTNAPDTAALLAGVSPDAPADPGLLMDRARWMVARGDEAGAWRLVAGTRIAPGSVRDPLRWMRWRLELARAAERAGQYEAAYGIAAGHATYPMGVSVAERPLAERDVFTDLEFLAGWVAFHDQRRPRDGLVHFLRYEGGARSPITRSKGLYWAGRAAEAAGDRVAARRYWEEAAAFPEAFHGQLAHERLGREVRVALQPAPAVSEAERAALEADPRVQTAIALGRMGEHQRQEIFLRHLVDRATGPAERARLADLGSRIGRRDVGVIAANAGRRDGDPLMAYGWPRLPVAADGARWSMIHAITRQESQFNRHAVSRAGARGLMQLMPATAADVARRTGDPYSVAMLTADEAYNVRLGSTYYFNRLDQLGGSHVLAVASYNAGIGNVRRWLASNGDPRAGADVIDWIEAIPFSETRLYVQRVLENAVVYDAIRRAEGQSAGPGRLSAYLESGRGSAGTVAAPAAGTSGAGAAGSASSAAGSGLSSTRNR
jgi:soluble lytic murein transglycosylase